MGSRLPAVFRQSPCCRARRDSWLRFPGFCKDTSCVKGWPRRTSRPAYSRAIRHRSFRSTCWRPACALRSSRTARPPPDSCRASNGKRIARRSGKTDCAARPFCFPEQARSRGRGWRLFLPAARLASFSRRSMMSSDQISATARSRLPRANPSHISRRRCATAPASIRSAITW